jgi:hypothetical protein
MDGDVVMLTLNDQLREVMLEEKFDYFEMTICVDNDDSYDGAYFGYTLYSANLSIPQYGEGTSLACRKWQTVRFTLKDLFRQDVITYCFQDEPSENIDDFREFVLEKHKPGSTFFHLSDWFRGQTVNLYFDSLTWGKFGPDTEAPVITTDSALTAEVGVKYTLPEFKANDERDGQVKIQSVELFKEGSTDPILVSGEKITFNEPGTYTFVVTASDVAGNCAEQRFTLTVNGTTADETAPEITANGLFVAEVGARRKGDVKELCEWIKPDFAAFTGVCNQHVETFGSLENVIKTKSEVFDFAPVVVCGEGLKGALAPEHASKACFVQNAVKNLQLFARETRFTLVLSGGEIDVCTKLLGEPAAENIALCATVCEKLGLSLDEIKQGVQKLDYIPHRLQLIEAGGAYILDDGYNANPKGAFEGIKALKRFEQRKVIVTPGIVETGVLEEQINADLGAALVGLDLVLLVGDTLVASVKNGYLAAGGNAENLRVYPTLDGARNALEEYLQAGDAVLFLNDLPDVY